MKAREGGIDIHPVWNKSNREHTIIKSKPDDVRAEADAAVTALGFTGDYYVDADHIGLKTVEAFIPGSNFFTLDVADFTGKAAESDAVETFLKTVRHYTGSLSIPGIDRPFEITEETVRGAAGKFLLAVQEAGRIYRHVEERKGRESFVTEVSVDETDSPQNPVELFLILAMIAGERAHMPIIFITGFGDVPTSVRAMKAGAAEFLTKPFGDDVLLDAIVTALERSRAAVDEETALQVLRKHHASLSRREREVMALVVSGLLNKQVGGELGISEITVKAHRGRVMEKMKARSFAELVKMSARLGAAA